MKFLAVDDEEMVRKLLVNTLAEAEPGCIVEQAMRAKDALELVKTELQEPFDAAFLDIEMPGMSGLQLAKQIKDICGTVKIVFVTGFSQYALDAFSVHAHGYILKPITLSRIQQEIDYIKEDGNAAAVQITDASRNRLSVTCFGNFDVRVNGNSLVFPRRKSKELLAYLVDKRGTHCSTKELCAAMFEDKEYNRNTLSQMQKIISTLMTVLKTAGAADAVDKRFNSMAIRMDKIDCDFYRFLSGDIDAVNSYTGEYMTDYEWAEMTAGWIEDEKK